MDHAKVMNSCDDKFRRVGLAKLAPAERVVHLVSWANFEIENGGLSQFLWNSSGEHATETVEALEQVGAHQAAATLVEAIALLGPGGRVGDTDYQTVSGPLWELTKKCYDQKPDMFDCLCAFIDAHETELRAHGT